MGDGCVTPPEYAVLAVGGSSEFPNCDSEPDSRPDSPEIELQCKQCVLYPRPDPLREPPKWCTESEDSPTYNRPGKWYTASAPRQDRRGSRFFTATPNTPRPGGQGSRIASLSVTTSTPRSRSSTATPSTPRPGGQGSRTASVSVTPSTPRSRTSTATPSTPRPGGQGSRTSTATPNRYGLKVKSGLSWATSTPQSKLARVASAPPSQLGSMPRERVRETNTSTTMDAELKGLLKKLCEKVDRNERSLKELQQSRYGHPFCDNI